MESRRVQRALEILGQCGAECCERTESKLGSAAFIGEHSLANTVFDSPLVPPSLPSVPG